MSWPRNVRMNAGVLRQLSRSMRVAELRRDFVGVNLFRGVESHHAHHARVVERVRLCGPGGSESAESRATAGMPLMAGAKPVCAPSSQSS